MKNRIAHMQHALAAHLSPILLEITDDSAAHHGHAGARNGAGHYTVRIQSHHFTGKSLLACHRAVYDALGDMMKEEIHALRIEIPPLAVQDET